MRTAFSTGPGFFGANSRQSDDTVPEGVMRFYVARIEAYEGPIRGYDEAMAKTEFKLLPAMCDGKPEVARALLNLHESLTANLALIKAEAKRS